MKPLPPCRGKVGMGVECFNHRILYLERTTPTLTLPLQGGGNFTYTHEPSFMRSPCYMRSINVRGPAYQVECHTTVDMRHSPYC